MTNQNSSPYIPVIELSAKHIFAITLPKKSNLKWDTKNSVWAKKKTILSHTIIPIQITNTNAWNFNEKFAKFKSNLISIIVYLNMKSNRTFYKNDVYT